MYEIFIGLTQLLAPFIPFITEEMYQNLRIEKSPESVHLCDYLVQDQTMMYDDLEKGMQKLRELVEAGRALRSKIGIKVRYPLKQATIVCSKKNEQLIKDILDLLKEELNVKDISFSRDSQPFMRKTLKPNHSRLGPKYKEKAKTIVATLETYDPETLFETLNKENRITLEINKETITLTLDDFEISEQENENIARADVEEMMLFLDKTLTKELEAEGFAREIVRRIQSMRKELDLEVEEQIITELAITDKKKPALEQWKEYIVQETRSKTVTFVADPSGTLVKQWTIDALDATIGIRTA
jgi:isoleucyl-tRNA synthetase